MKNISFDLMMHNAITKPFNVSELTDYLFFPFR